MAEPIPAAGGTPRRWWDLTPKELNIVAFTLIFLARCPMLTKIFTSDFGTHIALGGRSQSPRNSPSIENVGTTRPRDGEREGGEWGFQAVLYLVSPSRESTESHSSLAVVFGIFLPLPAMVLSRGRNPLSGPGHLRVLGFLRIRIQPAGGSLHICSPSLRSSLSELLLRTRRKLIYLFPPMNPRVGEQPPRRT